MIFISYRRADTMQATGRIRERLAARYGAENIFLDIEDIAPGVQFPAALDDALGRSDVVLVLIGPRWADAQNGPRLFDSADIVRQEIEAALGREDVTAIPVVVDRAPFPPADQVPESLHPLLQLNAASIESGVDFELGMQRLIERIEAISAAAAERRSVVTLRGDAWQLHPQPVAEAITALARDPGEPGRLFAHALLAKRILVRNAGTARWLSYATLPEGAKGECFATSAGTLWVGATGRLFRYDTAELRWRTVDYFASLGDREVRWIAVNPADPSHILAGTGRYWSGMRVSVGTAMAATRDGQDPFAALGEANWTPDPGFGDLHGSRDGGVTWRTGPFRNVNRVCFAETSPGFVYVATSDKGLFVSTNGTASFRPSPGTDAHKLYCAAVSPHDPMHVVLGTRSDGAFASFDAGQTWSHPIDGGDVFCIAFAPADPGMVLVGTTRGALVSSDGGRTFTSANRGLVHGRPLAALPLESGAIVLGSDGGGIYERTAADREWRQVHRGLLRPGIGALTFDADGVLYMGGGDTLWRTEDRGRSFQPLHQEVGEVIRSICVFASSAAGGAVVRWNRDDVLLIGTERGNIFRSGDYAETWEHVLRGGGGSVRKIARAAGGALYAAVAHQPLRVSRDDGRTWADLDTKKLKPVTFALWARALLIGTSDGAVLRSDDAGATWNAAGTGLPKAPVLSLAVADGGAGLLAGLQDGGIWRWNEGAETWTSAGGEPANESVNDICCRGPLVLIATNRGVFRSMDGGVSWESYSGGMSNIQQVTRLALHGDGRTAFCGEVGGLYGRLVLE